MYKIVVNTPFGFIMELENRMCFFTAKPFHIYLNRLYYGSFQSNVVSVFGLACGQTYEVRVEGETEHFSFEITTESPEYLIDVREYHATGDGVSDDSAAINAAIYAAPKGAVVYIPAGEYLVQHIFLKSNVDIYLAKGAVIKQDTNRNHLAILKGFQKSYTHEKATINGSWEGNPLDMFGSLIFGKEVHHIHIYGEGVLDGSGAEGNWWVNVKEKKEAYRPKNLFLIGCSHIKVSGITSQNSASWNMHPMYCSHISFYGLTILSPEMSPNTDGINPESCFDTEIIGCSFHVGDDCIALKSGKYFMREYDFRPTKDVLIRNCRMQRGHCGVAIGSEAACGVKNVCITQCYMEGTDRGLRIKTRRGRGDKAVTEGIHLHRVVMKDVSNGITVNMFYNCDPDGHSSYVRARSGISRDDRTPFVKDIQISEVEAVGLDGCAIFAYGLPERKIEKIQVEGCRFSFAGERSALEPEMLDDFEGMPKPGIFVKNVENFTMTDTVFEGDYVRLIEGEQP